MQYQFIELEKNNRVAIISLNTPKNYNALNVEILEELYNALEKCENDDSIRVIILTGKGKLFSSGGNVKEFLTSIENGTAEKKIADISKILHQCVLKILDLKKPTIGKIRGGAYGAGLNLVLSCDFVYADEDAILDEAFVNVGLSVDGGGTYTIPRLVGMRRSKEFFWLGGINGKKAEKWGIINAALPKNDLDDYVNKIAEKCANLPPINVINTKISLKSTFINSAKEQLDLERERQIKTAASKDFAEGVKAFFEKRRPNYEGK
ncbi:MAG: enoyl-CoA hydratase/isomerase family protein [Candidatus Helarchaeota archaeon]